MADQVFSSLLTMTCSISRRTYGTTGDFNLPVETFTVINASAKCLIQPQKEYFDIDVRGKKERTNLLAFFEFAESIIADDIITYGGGKWQVLGIENAGGQNHHWECFLLEIS
jgi:hypothetical protein